MIPNNALSSQPVQEAFLVPTRLNALIDYEWGGIGIGNVLTGRSSHLWRSAYVNGQIILSNGIQTHTVATIANVQSISFAFDLNMNPYVAYTLVDGRCFFQWHDPIVGNSTTTEYVGVSDMQLTLDDFRPTQNAQADVILAYIKQGILCVRNQRERFDMEHSLGQFDGLLQMGMMQNHRLGFKNITIWKNYE